MSEEEKREKDGKISRREFLKDAGFIVGGAAIASTALLAACGPKEEATTKTVTETIFKFVCPFDGQEFASINALVAHMEAAHPGEVETITKFACPSCGQEFTSLAALKTHFETAHPPEVVEVAEKLTKLIVNGETHEIKVEPNWTLNFVLREKLKLTGVKIWCEEGACGVCTVLMDGVPIFSCMTLATECEGRNIETIEGLSDGVTLHPVQQAFIENFGLQCGYCTPGMILVTKALLSENPNPTEEDVKEALAGNICKCGDYKQIIASVLAAAEK